MKIHTWIPGTKISEPGAYVMPLEIYHTDICDGPSVSSSGLRTIETQSLAHYWCDSYLNPDREPFEQTASMILGSGAHHLLLGEKDFHSKFVLRPEEAPDGRAWNGNNNSCKEWLGKQAKAGLVVLKPEQLKDIVGMAKSLGKHPLIKQGLMNGHIETSLIWKDKETGIWLKARPDVIAADGTIINDLKTTADASPGECERTVANFGYHLQMALAGMAFETLFGRRPGNDDYVLTFVEPKPPYAVSIRPVDPMAIHYGRLLIRRALRKLAAALASGEFPAYETDLTNVNLPAWELKRLEGEIKYGLLQEDAA